MGEFPSTVHTYRLFFRQQNFTCSKLDTSLKMITMREIFLHKLECRRSTRVPQDHTFFIRVINLFTNHAIGNQNIIFAITDNNKPTTNLDSFDIDTVSKRR